jgi:hypothetical protein
MRSYVQQLGLIDEALQGHLNLMENLIRRMPDNGEEIWSCHAVVRGLKKVFDLPYSVKDGFFQHKGIGHAWLWLSDDRRQMVIDVWPMGAHGGPILSDARWFGPWSRIYIEDAAYHDQDIEKFEREAALFVEAAGVIRRADAEGVRQRMLG